MKKCTWKNCNNEGKIPQKDRNGKEWAFLCVDHDKEIDYSFKSAEPKKILRCRVLALGGAEKLIERIFKKDGE